MFKAIDTEYNGCLFRSRLEARWAVFFDAMGTIWKYEPEGYEIDGIRYLPDFFLPVQECWFEVKPFEPSENEKLKAVKLSHETYPIVIANGQPCDNDLSIYCADTCDSGGGVQWWSCYLAWCGQTGLCFDSDDNREDRAFHNPRNWNHFEGMRLSKDCTQRHPLILESMNAARSARFEHGHSGRTL